MPEKGITSKTAVQPVSQTGSPLRAKMIEVMTQRGMTADTQLVYVRAVLRMVVECGRRSPEAITVAEARRYVAGLKERGVSSTLCS